MTKPKLITSKLSPYGHKVEMVLIEKNIPYEKQEVDLANRPEWFVKDAPLGKVPLLYIDNKILFESSVICEYLEETNLANSLHSKDPAIKALNRAWVEFSSTLGSAIFAFAFANSENSAAKKDDLISKIAILEKNLSANPYFNGSDFLLVDIALACSLKPLVFLDNKYSLNLLANSPKLTAYAANVTARESLAKVLPQNYEELFALLLARKKSHLV